MIKYLKKLEVAKDKRSVFVNDKYEIDAYSGCVYYDPEYTGDRSKDFPQWIFKLVEKLQVVGIIGK